VKGESVHHNLRPKWEVNDFTAEDLILSKPGEAIKVISEEDSVNQPIFTWGSVRAICSCLRAWSRNDFTNKGDFLADACTLFVRHAAPWLTTAEVGLTDYNGANQEDDYCYEDPIRLDIEIEDVGKCETPIIQDIYDLYKECSKDNWDGYGAKRIPARAYLEAIRLAELIPRELPLPEVVPEPNGDIAFEWYRGKRFLFVLSVEGNNIINYAGLFGSTTRIYGSEYFTDELPTSVLERIQRLFL
jgi:hypothetical protein